MLRYTQNSLLYPWRERTTKLYLRVLHHLPLHLTPLVSVTTLQTVLRSIASFASYWCSTLPNNLLLQKVKFVYNVSHLSTLHSLPRTWVIKHFLHCWRDVIASFASRSTLLNNLLLQKVKLVYNVSQLFINLRLDSVHFRHYKGTYQFLAEVDTVHTSPWLLEAATTATSLQSQLARRTDLFWGSFSNIFMEPSIDKSSKKFLQERFLKKVLKRVILDCLLLKLTRR